MRDRFASLLRTAAWAPITVLLVHQFVMRSPWRSDLNWTIHFFGGAAAAYFLFHATGALERELGRLQSFTRLVLAYGWTAVVALGWEFLEFAVDRLYRMQYQHGLVDTIGDLFFGMLGALVVLAVMALRQRTVPCPRS